jgi:hypothetical protein
VAIAFLDPDQHHLLTTLALDDAFDLPDRFALLRMDLLSLKGGRGQLLTLLCLSRLRLPWLRLLGRLLPGTGGLCLLRVCADGECGGNRRSNDRPRMSHGFSPQSV